MQTFCDILKWYNNKDVEPTLMAMRKLIDFYHSKRVDLLKLGYPLPNSANRFLHSSTEKDKNYNNYIRKRLTAEPWIIFTNYAKVGETKTRESENKANIWGRSCESASSFFLDKKRCQHDQLQNGSTMKRLKNSIQRRTGETTSESGWWTLCNRLIPTVKQKPKYTQEAEIRT